VFLDRPTHPHRPLFTIGSTPFEEGIDPEDVGIIPVRTGIDRGGYWLLVCERYPVHAYGCRSTGFASAHAGGIHAAHHPQPIKNAGLDPTSLALVHPILQGQKMKHSWLVDNWWEEMWNGTSSFAFWRPTAFDRTWIRENAKSLCHDENRVCAFIFA